MIEVPDGAIHYVDGDAAEVDERQDRFPGPADDVMDELSGALGANGVRRDPGRKLFQEILLVEAFSLHSIGTSLTGKRTLFQEREKKRSRAAVILGHIDFGDTLFRPPDFGGMCDGDSRYKCGLVRFVLFSHHF